MRSEGSNFCLLYTSGRVSTFLDIYIERDLENGTLTEAQAQAVSYTHLNKQGYHEDELLTYNLANSANTLKTDGEWNSGADFIDYLSVSDGDRSVSYTHLIART